MEPYVFKKIIFK